MSEAEVFFLDVITKTADKKIQQWKIHLFKYVMTIQAFLKTKIDKINLMNHEYPFAKTKTLSSCERLSSDLWP